MRIEGIPKKLRYNDEPGRDVFAVEADAVELLRGVCSRSTQTTEHLSVVVEDATEHLGQHKHQLSVVDRLDDLLLNKPAEDLGALLLAT